ncbi:MAG: tRNA preQ1(34) S-adenosylmethionine ribosyltransferase-isomerase QueA [bacterium]
MLTSSFNYNLPKELIAQEPPPMRGMSRMMVIHRGSGCIEHRMVRDLPEYLNATDLLVLNDTKVFPARLQGVWADTGGAVELLLTDPLPLPLMSYPEQLNPETTCWSCISGSGRGVRAGLVARFANGEIEAHILERTGDGICTALFYVQRPLMKLLHDFGHTPVPPYICRKGDREHERLDRERYQTIYARETGAVAAPTAGLHFTDVLFAELDAKGVSRATVTLHVGPGTFKPVKCETVEAHKMDPERFSVSQATADAIDACKSKGGRVVAVGSTTVRTLETVATAHNGKVVSWTGASSIFIYPPYDFKVIDVMLTNFHLPQSTLIMMVSALAGRDLIFKAYQEAVEHKYRFFSYGDCMLIL